MLGGFGLEDNEIQNIIEVFLREKYYEELLDAARSDKKSITVDFNDLDRYNPDVADILLERPNKFFSVCDDAVDAIDLPTREDIRIRFRELPEYKHVRIRNLRAEHVGKFITIEGVVRRASDIRPEISEAIFECPKCGGRLGILQTSKSLRKPNYCECGHKGRFEMKDKRLFDARWIAVEEPFEITEGEKPSELTVYLKEDLTTPKMQKKTDPGNRLLITGILKEQHRSTKGKKSTRLEILMDANHMETTEVDYDELKIEDEDIEEIKKMAKDPNIKEKLIASMAPAIHGLNDVKEAILLQLFGGVRQYLSDGTTIRGDIHILLLGDPSAGKSQLLKLVSSVVPRGKYVSGKGATGAGLTATVTKDEQFMGGWVLEAGALVLANKGLMAIDEFDKMHKEDVVAMHEALEQQTISIAKANIVATLPAETAVLAGANPKFGRFDPYKSIAEQITIPDTLLSRFDVKFALRDVPDQDRDQRIAGHILDRATSSIDEAPISQRMIKKYVAYARQTCKPKITEEAKDAIKQFYLKLRGLYGNDETPAVAIATRQLEALIRMSQAVAKIYLEDTVKAEHAREAIKVMTASLRQLGWDPETGQIDIDRTEGMASSQRSKIRKVLDLIEDLEKDVGKTVPMEDIMAAAQEEGLGDVKEIVRKLKNEGMVFEPRPGYVQKI